LQRILANGSAAKPEKLMCQYSLKKLAKSSATDVLSAGFWQAKCSIPALRGSHSTSAKKPFSKCPKTFKVIGSTRTTIRLNFLKMMSATLQYRLQDRHNCKECAT
jgi:hypothetical protein